MVCRTGVLLGLLLALAGFAVAKKTSPTLAWKPTYAEALLEARIRGIPVFVTRHTDECGRCLRQRRRVLTDPTFVAWANENLTCLVVHMARDHDAVEHEEDGKKILRCPLYPGLTCRDHVRAAVDVDTAREEGLVKVPFVPLCPNSWLVAPTNEVERIPEKAQFDPKAIRKQTEALQAKLGPPLPHKPVAEIRKRLLLAEAKTDDALWREALEALAGIEKLAPKPPKSLLALIKLRLAAVDENAGYEAEDVLEAEKVTAETKAEAKRLIDALDVPVNGQRVPLRTKLVDWLGRQA